jgi:hypothetical protein
MTITFVPLVVAIIGLVLYAPSWGGKINTIGIVTYGCGLAAFLLHGTHLTFSLR